jgi:transposase
VFRALSWACDSVGVVTRIDTSQPNLDRLALVTVQVEPTPPEDRAPDDEEALEPKKARKRGHGRTPLPRDLPRERIEYEPALENLVCACCGEAKSRIDEETSEELEYVPASKGRAGPGLLAKVVVAKYGDHLSLNRLEGIFVHQVVHLARSTMCDWVRDVAGLLSPIARR